MLETNIYTDKREITRVTRKIQLKWFSNSTLRVTVSPFLPLASPHAYMIHAFLSLSLTPFSWSSKREKMERRERPPSHPMRSLHLLFPHINFSLNYYFLMLSTSILVQLHLFPLPLSLLSLSILTTSISVSSSSLRFLHIYLFLYFCYFPKYPSLSWILLLRTGWASLFPTTTCSLIHLISPSSEPSTLTQVTIFITILWFYVLCLFSCLLFL